MHHDGRILFVFEMRGALKELPVGHALKSAFTEENAELIMKIIKRKKVMMIIMMEENANSVIFSITKKELYFVCFFTQNNTEKEGSRSKTDFLKKTEKIHKNKNQY